jgi:hypothetical protein
MMGADDAMTGEGSLELLLVCDDRVLSQSGVTRAGQPARELTFARSCWMLKAVHSTFVFGVESSEIG